MPEPVSLAVADIATLPVPEAGIDGVVVGGALSTRRVIAAVCAVWPPVSVATARSWRLPSVNAVVSSEHVRGVVAWKAQTSFHVAVPAARCWIFTPCSPGDAPDAVAVRLTVPLIAPGSLSVTASA